MKNKITIVDLDEAENADVTVCVLATEPLIFPDNVTSVCRRCFKTIQHRPDAPTTPTKICWMCADADVKREAAKGALDLMMTRKTQRELFDYFRKKSAN